MEFKKNSDSSMVIAIIGGGAAGIMAAISAKEHYPEASVSVFEKSGKFLSKVKVSGGGRCNVTHQLLPVSRLLKAYPRGAGIVKKTLPIFGQKEVISWFESHGVQLKTESDGRMFPVTDSSHTVMDCLLNTARAMGITLIKQFPVYRLNPLENGKWELVSGESSEMADKVIVATGGSPMPGNYQWLADLGHHIQEPLPSLFTFNLVSNALRNLQGISVADTVVRIKGSSHIQSGPLLITHWGISGPAVLKLSAFAAEELASVDYRFEVMVNWTGERDQQKVKALILQTLQAHPNRKLWNSPVFGLPQRLWHFLAQRAGIAAEKPNNEIGQKLTNKLVEVLCNDTWQVDGRTTFKEEFVTCGGVLEDSISLPSLQSKSCPGLYFCGEVLNIDGITGGFNFQSAWTTGYVAGMLLD